MVFNIALALLLISFLTIIITVFVYSWFNKEDESVVAINQTLRLISQDTSSLLRNFKAFSDIMSEVAQPLLSPSTIDVVSNEVQESSGVHNLSRSNDDVEGVSSANSDCNFK